MSSNRSATTSAPTEPDWNALWVEQRSKSTWGARNSYSSALWDAHWRREPKHYFDQTARVRWILDHLPMEKPSRILDLACGNGPLAVPLAKAGHDVTGIDISPVGIDRLNAVAQAEGLANLRGHHGNWLETDLGALDLPYDVALVSYGLGTVEPRPFLEKMVAAARCVIAVEPAGTRHWQHPEFWNLLDDQTFDPGPDYRMIESLLRQMGHAPTARTGVYETSIAFETLEEAVVWLLVNTGLKSVQADKAARRYLQPRLSPENGALVLRQKQSIAMLSVTPE